MTYEDFLKELDKAVDNGNLKGMKELLDKYPAYRDNYGRELDGLQREAEDCEELCHVDIEDFYQRLKKKLQEGK